MSGNAGFFFDLDNALGGHLALFPAHDRGLMNAEERAEFLEAHALGGAKRAYSGRAFCVGHTPSVAYNATERKPFVAYRANDALPNPCQPLRAMQLMHIHKGKTPARVHFIPEWAERRGKRQADFVSELGVDKATVSRWFAGIIPTPDNLERVAAFLGLKNDLPALFRHPDDDWIFRLFKGRSDAEKERMKATLKAAFPRSGTQG